MLAQKAPVAPPGFDVPGKGEGLRDVLRRRFLLRLLVNKELKVRYRGSALGLLWSYVKPAVMFCVLYVAMGIILDRGGSTQNYALYLFSGMVVVTYFTEAFGNATRSILGNGALVKKIYMPRELFPVASTWVSAVHFLPGLVVLVAGALSVGWRPQANQLFGAVLGFLIVTFLAIGAGLLAASLNIFFRDVENLVDLYLSVVVWLSPVIYTWELVRKNTTDLVFTLYMYNPITIAIELFHWAFWYPTIEQNPENPALAFELPGRMFVMGFTGLAISLAFLFVGQLVFRRLEGRFAQEL